MDHFLSQSTPDPVAGQVTRREWIGSAAALALSAGCRGRSDDAKPGNQLKVFNWSDYIHESVILEFERQTGCSVVYDNYSSDSELETRLATGGGGYDVVFPSDRAMAALVAKGLLSDLDRSRLTNFRHLDPKFLAPPFDATNRFSVPYFWGTLAVGVRTDHVERTAKGLEVLFDPRYRGRITMLDDMENVVAAVLGHLGFPLNSIEPEHLRAAERLLLEQKPLVQAYTSDSYRERLISGEAWAALGWSGDLLQADQELAQSKRGESRVRVIIPPGGTMIWIDSMVIPKAARNIELAHEFINYLLEPTVAALNAQKVNYATPNAAARSLLPAAMLADESIYPPPELLARCTWLESRGREIEKIERVWRVVRQ
jgi:spermidine/putrescine transport system substrate-binding protein